MWELLWQASSSNTVKLTVLTYNIYSTVSYYIISVQRKTLIQSGILHERNGDIIHVEHVTLFLQNEQLVRIFCNNTSSVGGFVTMWRELKMS
jgi:hypothetical protein